MKLLISILAILTAVHASAQSDLITVKYDGVSMSAASAADAVREITAQATETTARNQVIELIGEAKYRKNREVIDKRIISQSSKFIPFTRPSQAAQSPTGFKVSVELKVSPDSLRKIVQSAGLLADTETPGTLISLVAFTDKNSEISFKSWAPESAEGKLSLATLQKIWQAKLSSDLKKKGFELAPISRSSFSEAELVTTAKAQMVVRGEGRYRKLEDGTGTFALKVGVFQASDSRLLVDLTRSTKLARFNEATVKAAAEQMFTEVSKELTATVHEAWQSGVVGSTAVQIAAVGTLTPKQFEDFKTELNRTVRDLKNVRDRKFSSGRVVLEADFKGSLSTLTDQLKKAQLPSFQTEVGNAESNEIELRVKARR